MRSETLTRQPRRTDAGGRINRQRPITFTFDGRSYGGFEGDTLASALLANGVTVFGRSFKLHRRRGILGAGPEEPNALVSLRSGDRHEPNVPATLVELFDGLEARSQNRWPSLGFDAMGAFGLLAPVFSAGFYYKTFIGPTRKSWLFYEHFIRKAAGMGEPTNAPDPDRYEKAHAFCDVLVVGSGAAGLAAALAAGRSGARVILAEDDTVLGGGLLSVAAGGAEEAWLIAAVKELSALPNVRVMTRTTVFGAYDGMTFGLLERVSDHLAEPPPHQPRQRYWRLRCRQAVLATGAIERPIVFGNNDLPGIMLASAVRTYLNRFGVLPGREVVAFTTNDSAYGAAIDLAKAGAKVTVADVRPAIGTDLKRQAAAAGITIHAGCAVGRATGKSRVNGADVVEFDGADPQPSRVKLHLSCDLLICSGGWNPTLHLLGQRGAKPRFDADRATFVADAVPAGFGLAGSAAGETGLASAVRSGFDKGRLAAAACGCSAVQAMADVATGLDSVRERGPAVPVWYVPNPIGVRAGMKFVDLQHDVKLDDLALAQREGYVSVEHMKRYTTLGMAGDQGKTSNVNALGIAAGIRGVPVGEVGITTFRPPYRPVPVGALAGPETGRHFRPIRRTPMHDWTVRHGGQLTDAGLWQRAWYYPQGGEDRAAAYKREAGAVRKSVGMADISSLGKIDIQGPDAAEFLDRIYVNGFRNLPVGKARYGVMLRPDGMVFDDGTTSHIGEDHFFMTTTTANAGKVMTNLEFLLQTAWPELKVHVTSVTSQWAGISVAGPRSRDLLRGLVADVDFGNEAFPFMGVRHGHAGEIPVRLLRISFSGELAYELYTPAGYGEALWQAVHEAGKAFGIAPYGTEALGALRIEKGHVAGAELEGRTTLADLGLARMASRKKPYLGGALAQREGMADARRPQLVGLELANGSGRLRAGAILCDPPGTGGVAAREPHEPERKPLGFVSSVTWSAELGRDIGIGFLSDGPARQGEVINAVFPLYGESAAVRITTPHFVDPQGERLNA